MKMSECQHQWDMANIQFGFVVFEKCFHCNCVRTYFTREGVAVLGDEYREGDHFWHRVENAQSFRFDLRCSACGALEPFDDMMGLFYCTGCQPECRVEKLRKELEAKRTYLVLACGFLREIAPIPGRISRRKLEELSRYFNQRRDTSRSRIEVAAFDLETGFAQCQGEFLHDVGMLSPEPVTDRKSPF
jgi:hypothetical protein